MSKLTNRIPFINFSLLAYFCASVLLCSFIAFKSSAATLIVTDNLILRDIDDKAVEHGFLSKQQEVKLSKGKHTLVVKYEDVFEDIDFAEERLVKSDYFVVKFLVNNQQKLTLSTTEIRNLATAERFAKKPELTLLDERNQEVILALETLSNYELAKQVTQVVTTLSAPVITTQGVGQTPIVSENEQSFNNKVIEKVDAVPMLKYWWKKADQNEKDNFIRFINETN